MTTLITQEKMENGILILSLNRPEKLNALNADMLNQLSEGFRLAASDKRINAVILSGQGKAFCAGADISALEQADQTQALAFATAGQRCFDLLETLGKPSVAAIHCYAFGGGCELAMAATFRVATPQASFSQPEIKLGILPGYGGTQRLSRLVGKARALELCLSGDRLSAETALNWGLITEITPESTLLEKAITRLTAIGSLAPKAVTAIMDTIHRGYDLPLSEALAYEAKIFSSIAATPDAHEGIQAFLEKRKPQFTGE